MDAHQVVIRRSWFELAEETTAALPIRLVLICPNPQASGRSWRSRPSDGCPRSARRRGQAAYGVVLGRPVL